MAKLRKALGTKLDGYYISAPGDAPQHKLQLAPTVDDIDARIKDTKDKALIAKLTTIKTECTTLAA